MKEIISVSFEISIYWGAHRRSVGIDLIRTPIVRLEVGQWLNMLLAVIAGNKWTKVIVPVENSLVTTHTELELDLKSTLLVRGDSQIQKMLRQTKNKISNLRFHLLPSWVNYVRDFQGKDSRQKRMFIFYVVLKP